MAAVVALSIDTLQPLHSRDQISFRRFHKQMVMISHKYIGMDAPAGFPAGVAKGGQESLPILIVAKDDLALVSARHDVIKGSGIFDAQSSRHDGDRGANRPFRQARISQLPRTDPFFGVCNCCAVGRVTVAQIRASFLWDTGHSPGQNGISQRLARELPMYV